MRVSISHDWLISARFNQMHLIPPILTYVRLPVMCVNGILPSTVNAARKHDEHTNPFNPRTIRGARTIQRTTTTIVIRSGARSRGVTA